MVTFLISQWSTNVLTGFLGSMNKKERARMWELLSQSGLFGSKLGHYFKAKLGHPQLCHKLHLLFACSPQIHLRCKPGVFSGIFLEHVSSPGHSHRTLPSLPSPPLMLDLSATFSIHSPLLRWSWPVYVFNSFNSHYTLPEDFSSAWEWMETKIGLCTRQSGQRQADKHIESK